MADSFLFHLAGVILRKLDSLDLQDKGELKETVSKIQDVLRDAEQRSERDAGIRHRLGELQPLMYDIDDVLDDCLHAQSLRRRRLNMGGSRVSKEVRLFFSSSNKLVYGVKVGRRMRHIMSRLNGIALSFEGQSILPVREVKVDMPQPHDRETHGRSEFNIIVGRDADKEVKVDMPQPQDRETHGRSEFNIIVGRDTDKEAIVETLLFEDYEENVLTVSIVGVGGMGKTMLAHAVSDDERVTNLFELRIWVYVGENFDVRLIIQKIGENLSRASLQDLEIDSLAAIIREKIRAEKFLLVLDDVWNEDLHKWLMLVNLLNLGARGSRILLTTRNAQVAQVTTNPIRVHYLHGLSKRDSWLLFERCAFETGQVPSITQRVIGDGIISKCAGNPMAIRAMGSLLYLRKTDPEWSEFISRDSEWSEFINRERGMMDGKDLKKTDPEWSEFSNRERGTMDGKDLKKTDPEFSNRERGTMDGKDLKKTDPEWSEFSNRDSEWSEFSNRERGTMDGKDHGIFSILRISYNDLPPGLKQCFACCSLFPKNHKMRVPKLINLWMALGFLRQSVTSSCLEDIGLLHFTELLGRSFFEEVEKDDFGNIISCKMHNLMHDLAKTVAGTEFILSSEDGTLIEEKSRHAAFFIDPTPPFKVPPPLLKARKLRTFLLMKETRSHLGALQLIDPTPPFKVPPPLLKARKLRTFLLMNETRSHIGALQPGCRLEEHEINQVASNLRLLRVLDLHSSCISRVPSSVCKLKLLTYLDLSENKLIKVLPDSITRLLSLQILKLDNCERLKRLPKDTKVLVSLIHLGVENCGSLTHMPSGIVGLTSLYTLSRFVLPIDCSISNYGGLCELQSLNDLRGTLKIYNLPHTKGAKIEFEAANLKEKKDLRLLRLEWSDGDENQNDYDANDVGDDQEATEKLEPHLNLERLELVGYMGSGFPTWLSSLTNLVGLALESCEKCQCLPQLHQLNHLKSLAIEGLTALEYVHDGEFQGGNSEVFFPSLEELVLSDCPELQGWWKPAPATSPKLELPCLSRLSQLSIMACPKLSSISMPVFPPLNSVKFSDSQMTKLQQILVPPEATSSGSSSSSSLYPAFSVLAKLETLEIEAITDLVSLPEDLFRNLESLKTFRVSKCRRLETLFQAISHLSCLATLSIETCQGLDLCDGYARNDDTQWQGRKSLHSLSIDRIPNLGSLPEWIRHLTLLQRLEISGCRKLPCLPAWMMELRALQILIITWCPQLTPRCQSNGVDWPHISHIPNIIVARKAVKGSLIA